MIQLNRIYVYNIILLRWANAQSWGTIYIGAKQNYNVHDDNAMYRHNILVVNERCIVELVCRCGSVGRCKYLSAGGSRVYTRC